MSVLIIAQIFKRKTKTLKHGISCRPCAQVKILACEVIRCLPEKVCYTLLKVD